MRIIFVIVGIFFLSCNNISTMNSERPIDIFQKIITGDFDNSKQVAEEIANAKQIHPLAKHVNRVIDYKIDGLPNPRVKSDFWILEESYYEYPGKPIDIKPYLFHFSANGNDKVNLKVYQLPVTIKKEDFRNDNANWRLVFSELKESPTFKGTTYFFNKAAKTFTTNSVNDLGNGMRFTLTETLSLDKLIVMELLEKEGKRITPYDTPIIYDKK